MLSLVTNTSCISTREKRFLLIFTVWILKILTLENYKEHVDYNRSRV